MNETEGRQEIANMAARYRKAEDEFNGRIDRLNDDNNRLRAELAATKVHQDATCCMLDEAQSGCDALRAELAAVRDALELMVNEAGRLAGPKDMLAAIAVARTALQSHRRTEEK